MNAVLAGRRVVVTRAAEQADELAELLARAGAIPVIVPLIEIVADDAAIAELRALARTGFASFDWLIVTSPNGAASVNASRHNGDPRAMLRVAAVGDKTAASLRSGGFDVAVVPRVQSAAGLLSECEFTGAVLIVQAADAEPTLASELTSRGLAVTVVAPYRAVAVRVDTGMQLAALAADAVLFASGSAARAWVAAFGDSTPPIVVAIGPQTAAAAVAVGLKVDVVAADHSLPGMVTALARHLSSSR